MTVIIAQAVHMFMTGDVDWNSYVTILSVLPALGLISPCILLPTVFKLGVEKGRIVYFAVIFAVCGTFAVLGALSIDLNMGQFMADTNSAWHRRATPYRFLESLSISLPKTGDISPAMG
mgnify:CR=1 FL=1